MYSVLTSHFCLGPISSLSSIYPPLKVPSVLHISLLKFHASSFRIINNSYIILSDLSLWKPLPFCPPHLCYPPSNSPVPLSLENSRAQSLDHHCVFPFPPFSDVTVFLRFRSLLYADGSKNVSSASPWLSHT